MPYDSINPAHYQTVIRGRKVGAADIIEAFGLDWHMGTAMKYILRAGKKPGEPQAQDIEKAIWYLKRKLARIKVEEANESKKPKNDLSSLFNQRGEK